MCTLMPPRITTTQVGGGIWVIRARLSRLTLSFSFSFAEEEQLLAEANKLKKSLGIDTGLSIDFENMTDAPVVTILIDLLLYDSPVGDLVYL